MSNKNSKVKFIKALCITSEILFNDFEVQDFVNLVYVFLYKVKFP